MLSVKSEVLFHFFRATTLFAATRYMRSSSSTAPARSPIPSLCERQRMSIHPWVLFRPVSSFHAPVSAPRSAPATLPASPGSRSRKSMDYSTLHTSQPCPASAPLYCFKTCCFLLLLLSTLYPIYRARAARSRASHAQRGTISSACTSTNACSKLCSEQCLGAAAPVPRISTPGVDKYSPPVQCALASTIYTHLHGQCRRHTQ